MARKQKQLSAMEGRHRRGALFGEDQILRGTTFKKSRTLVEQLYANRLLVLLCLSGFILAAVTIFAVVSDQSSPVETCEIGHWCFKGRFMYACPPGRFGNSTILDNSNCSGLCEAGYECLAGSITSRGAPHGRDGGDRLCPQGYYCGIGTGDATLYPCLAGKYGTSLGLSNPECDGNCAAGFYCPEGSSSRKQIVCPPGSYCQEGSPSPVLCPEGTYGSIEGLTSPKCEANCSAEPGKYCPSGSVQDLKEDCARGHFCDGSVGPDSIKLCPEGRWGSSTGLISPDCDGPCEEGFYCLPGSIAGHSRFDLDAKTPQTTKTGAVWCPEGHFCPTNSASPFRCKNGTYGAFFGVFDPDCSGRCDPGFFCPEGSTDAQQTLCQEGTSAV